MPPQKTPTTLQNASQAYINEVVEHHRNPELYRGFPSGFSGLDELTGGWQRKEYCVIGAKSGLGKTTFMTTAAINFMRQKVTWLWCGLEEEISEIVGRLFSGVQNIPRNSFRDIGLTEDEWPRVYNAHEELSSHKAWLHYGARNVGDIESLIMQISPRPQCVIIDYVQLMQGARLGTGGTRTQEVSEISGALARLSNGENGVLVLAACQLNKENGWLWSEDLFRDADLAIKIEEYLDESEKEVAHLRNIVVAKDRHGSIGEFAATFNGPIGIFQNMTVLRINLQKEVDKHLDEPYYCK